MASTPSHDFEPHETRRHKTIAPRPMRMSRPRIPDTITDNLHVPAHIQRVIAQSQAEDVADVPTALLPHRPTQQEMDDLKCTWLAMPTWDVEFSVGFELMQNELAAWHDEQIALRARAMGCSHLMASILEELVRCWIHGVPPRSPLAARVLASYR